MAADSVALTLVLAGLQAVTTHKVRTTTHKVMTTHRVTDPENKEHAIGAIMEDGTMYIDEELNLLQISSEYLEREKQHQNSIFFKYRQNIWKAR